MRPGFDSEKALARIANSTRYVIGTMPLPDESAYRTWMCLICGWIYDEATGNPADGIPPGTRWQDLPGNWVCPECRARKEDFQMIEI